MSNENQAQVQTLDSLVCVVLDNHLWSGRRKLTPKDLLKVAPENLPPQDLASLGSKKICDPGELKEFMRLKRKAERTLLESGYRFLGGYGIPADKLDEVRTKLQELQQEFVAYKSGFIARYDNTVETWVSRHREWETIIRKAVVPVREVESKIQFAFRIFRVAPAVDADEDDDSLMDGAYHSILTEVAQHAKESWENSFKGKAIVTQRALSPIRKMRDKLHGLSFVDVRIYPIVENIDGVLKDCPKTGKIEGGKLNELHSLVLLLSDTARMVSHGEAAIHVATNPQPQDAEEGDTEGTAQVDKPAAPEAEATEVVEAEGQTEAPAESEQEQAAVATPPAKELAVVESGLFF